YRSSRPEIQTSDGEIPEPWLAMAHRTDPGEQLIDGLTVEKAMLMLPPGYRTAFILHDIEGYKHGEAARLSGHAVGTSKSQLHKARASLRAVLSKRSTRASIVNSISDSPRENLDHLWSVLPILQK